MSGVVSFELKGQKVLVDEDDIVLIAEYIWHLHACRNEVYVAAQPGCHHAGRKRTFIRLHRLVMGAGPGQQVDHKNLNTLDNRKANLRVCTHTENTWNSRAQSNSRSGHAGVLRSGDRWSAQIQVHGKHYYLGTYDSIEEAIEVRARAAIEKMGEYARVS